MQRLIDILHASACSLVVGKGDDISTYNGRGVSDLYRILTTEPSALQGACIADKVVGKGAAALMILGGISALWADVISQAAVDLLAGSGIDVQYGRKVPHIINRQGTGMCPVEHLCADCVTAHECLPLISSFLQNINN
ncbi:MAG: DUF1893 domain-containing protein [Muribaculaceae bacterium]